jgi:hypothetical protein
VDLLKSSQYSASKTVVAINGLPAKILLSRGCGFRPKLHRIYLAKGRGLKLVTKVGNEIVQLYPRYEARKTLIFQGRKMILKFYPVQKATEWNEGQKILRKSHYMMGVNKGMMLVCRFERTSDEKFFLECSGAKKNTTRVGKIVGCAVIDSLYYGNPIGREEFAIDQLGKNWRTRFSRSEAVKLLQLGWVSRFALKQEYIKAGIGKLLARQVIRVAKGHRLPVTKKIEVIRTVTKQRASQLLSGNQKDFLIRAGFKLSQRSSKSRAFKDAVKLYYYTT